MNSIFHDFLDVYSSCLFIEAVGGVVPDIADVDFGVWHTYGGEELISVEGVTEGMETDSPGVTLEPFGLGCIRVFQSQRREGSQGLGLRVSLAAGAIAEHHADVEFLPVLEQRPDWSTPPALGVEYATEVIETYDGSEQRIALRDQPRLSVAYNYLSIDDFGNVNKITGPGRRFFVPLWHTETSCAIDGNTAKLDESNRAFEGARYVLVCDSYGTNLARVTRYDAGGRVVVFSFLVHKTLDKHASVVPLFPSTIFPELHSVSISSDIEDTVTAFEIDAGSMPPMDALEFIYEAPVLPFAPDRSVDITTTHARLHDDFDPGFGMASRVDRAQGTTRVFNMSFTFFSESIRQAFQDFAHSVRGAQREFWLESPSRTVSVIEDIQENSGTIIAKGLVSNTSPRLLVIKTHDGNKYYATIDVTIESNGVTEITTSTELPSISIKDIEYCAEAHLSRFEADNFSYQFETTSVSRITKTIKQVLSSDQLS